MGRNSFRIGEPTCWLLLNSLGIPSLLYVLHFPTKLPTANYQFLFDFSVYYVENNIVQLSEVLLIPASTRRIVTKSYIVLTMF